MNIKFFVLTFIGLLLLTTSCSLLQQSCAEATEDYRIQVEKLAAEWDSASALAKSTPRIQLVTPISTLQNIRNDYNNLTVPECAQTTHDLLLDYMDEIIKGYMAFLSDDEDLAVSEHFKQADESFDSWAISFNKLADTTEP